MIKMKIIITQRIVPEYRINFFRLLNNKLESNEIYFKVFHGSKKFPNNLKLNKLFKKVFSCEIAYSMKGVSEKIIILPTLLIHLIKYKPDLIISEGSSFFPNSIYIYLYSKIFKTPYVLWSLGPIPKHEYSKIRWFFKPFIELFEKNATSFICYSIYSRNYFSKKYGKPCYCAFNSIEKRHTKSEYKLIKSNINQKFAERDILNIVFIGRLIPQKKVNVLLEAISMIKAIPIHLYIIGDGNQEKELIKLTKVLKIDDKVSFLGKISEKEEKEEIFKKCHLGILPGLGGLAIQEMLWHGIPVITSSADGTELDLVKNGKGGLYLEKISNSTLSYVIVDYYKMDKDKKIQMAHNGLKIINNKYNLDMMVNSFIDAIKDNLSLEF